MLYSLIGTCPLSLFGMGLVSCNPRGAAGFPGLSCFPGLKSFLTLFSKFFHLSPRSSFWHLSFLWG